MLFNDDKSNENCQQRLGSGFRGGSIVLVSEICTMQNHLNHILVLGTLIRDVLICVRKRENSKKKKKIKLIFYIELNRVRMLQQATFI